MKRFYVAGAIVFLALAGVTQYLFRGLEWVPQAPFDIIGVLWLITNIPKLMVSMLTVALLFGAGYCVVRAVREPRASASLWDPRGEEARMLADPRFHAPRKKPEE